MKHHCQRNALNSEGEKETPKVKMMVVGAEILKKNEMKTNQRQHAGVERSISNYTREGESFTENQMKNNMPCL